jgi:AcrR family transcriptional regulator
MNAAPVILSGKGRVLDPRNDARVSRGEETRERLQAAFLAYVGDGLFRPSLAQLAGAADVPLSTLNKHYPRLSLLGAAVAERSSLLVLRAVPLRSIRPEDLSPEDRLALAHGLLVGQRYPKT